MGTKIDAGSIAKPFREDVKASVIRLKASGIGKYIYVWINKQYFLEKKECVIVLYYIPFHL